VVVGPFIPFPPQTSSSCFAIEHQPSVSLLLTTHPCRDLSSR
jgi:hypothetical protein